METREYVEYLLKNYHVIRKDIEQLKFELRCLDKLQPEEVIDAMNFTPTVGDKVDAGRVADKTCSIALVYREVTERMNNLSRQELERCIAANEYELMRLEYCINRLEGKVKAVVNGIYIEQKSWNEICANLYITEKTLSKYRKKGIDELAGMFALRRLAV